MRSMLLTVCLLFPVVGLGAEWVPPPDPDPQAILTQAKADMAAGDYEDALAKHLWYHENALAIQPAQTGVRLSFALMAWLELGEAYPPALEKMRLVRDETEKRIRDESQVRVRFGDFHDFVALNRTLRQEGRTAKSFEWLAERDEEDARRVFDVAKPALIKQKAYALCGRFIDPDRDVARIGEGYRQGLKLADERFGKPHREYTEKKLLNDASTLVAILVQNNRKSEAEAVAKEVKTFVMDVSLLQKLNKQLESALGGVVPTPWP